MPVSRAIATRHNFLYNFLLILQVLKVHRFSIPTSKTFDKPPSLWYNVSDYPDHYLRRLPCGLLFSFLPSFYS